jgi:hypothetical protein
MIPDIPEWARTVLSTTPARWSSLASSLPGELYSRRPGPKEWSALECLQHLVDTERSVFPPRVAYLLAEQDFPAFDPDSQGSPPRSDQSPSDLAAEFGRLRAEGLSRLDEVQPEDLGKKARHAELGMVSLSELLHEWAAHDLMHLIQAERALMQPFIQGSGPWQVYFQDHFFQPE